VAGSDRRDGVPVEGGSGRVAASSGVVMRLEAEAREGIAAWRRSGGENMTRGGEGGGSRRLRR
jgi:hypothetical protein